MAYYLQWPVSNGWVTTPDWKPTDVSNWSFEIDLVTPSTVAGDKTILGQEDSTASRAWKLFINNGNLGIIHVSNWSGGGFIVSPVAPSTRYLVRGEFDGSEIRLYFNDSLVASTSGRNLGVTSEKSHLSAFGRSLGSGASVIGDLAIYRAKFWDDATQTTLDLDYDPTISLDQGELVDAAGGNNGTPVNFPTNFNDALIFYNDGGGAVDYTITLDSGNYSLTGNTLSLLSDRNISLENGSYTLTGADLNLAVQRSLSLSQGIYSKQGTNTNLLLERLLGLDAGAYTKVGNSTELLVDRFIPLEQGAYPYIGSDINLQYGQEFRLSLEQGTYSLQGTEVGLLKDYILPLGTNSYIYTPENISLLANRKIITELGNYSYVGSPISFIYEEGGITYTLSLDSGDYSLTGQSLSLLANRKLPIDFGEYTYEGVNSDLLYNRVVALDSGVYTSAGTDTGLRVNRRLVFQNGNYSLQGTPITLSYTGEVLAILEGYRLSYKKHPIKQIQYKLYNITARYN